MRLSTLKVALVLLMVVVVIGGGTDGARRLLTARLSDPPMQDALAAAPVRPGEPVPDDRDAPEVDPPAVAEWLVYRGNPTRTALGTGIIPEAEYRWWHRDCVSEKYTNDLLRAEAKEADKAARPLLAGFAPLTAGQRLIYRSYRGVHAVDLRTDKLTWEVRQDWSVDGVWRKPFDRSARDARDAMTTWHGEHLAAGRQSLLVENSVTGTLSTDGKLVYAVGDLGVPPPPALDSERSPVLRFLREPSRTNRLQAISLDAGKVVWEISGPSVGSGNPETFFLGPPLPVEGKLFALVQLDGKKSEVRLLCLDAAKDPSRREDPQLWSVTVATLPGGPTESGRLLNDPERRTQAAHVASADAVAVCPTNAGVLAAVDLATTKLRWSFAYRKAGRPPRGWKVTAPMIHGGRVIYAPPDGDALICLRLKDGKELWRLKRKDELYPAGVWSDRVVLVGTGHCSAVALADGKELWRLETGVPSGQGLAAGSVYYLPLRSEAKSGKPEVCAVDVLRGTVAGRFQPAREVVPGNLLFHGDCLFSQTHDRLTGFKWRKP